MVQFSHHGQLALPPRYVLANPVRQLILSACSRGEVATSEFAERYRQKPENVRYHFRALKKAGYLRIARKKPARGVLRHYYVAVRQAVLMDDEFARMTMKERRSASRAILQEIFERCEEAWDAGTMGGRSVSHFSRRPLVLDVAGWTEVMGELKRVFELSFEIQAEALMRLKAMRRDEWIPVAFAIAGFESPAPKLVQPGAFFDYPGVNRELILRLFGRSRAALRAETMDARVDSHLTWSPFILEAQSWNDLTVELATARGRVMEIQAQALDRLRRSHEAPIHTTVGLLALETPEPARPNERLRLGWPPQTRPIHP